MSHPPVADANPVSPTPRPQRTLGGTGVPVSALGFGAAPLGNLYAPLDDDAARAAVDAAWEAGVRYFDTAPHYGLGLSERRLGAALAGRPRGEYTLSTKVGRLLEANPEPTGSDLAAGFAVPDTLRRHRDHSRDGVLASIEDSLRRLGTDRIDVVYVHDPEDHMDLTITAALPALCELREQGVIGAVGAGMNYVQPLRRIVAEADVDVVLVAGRWTLLDRTAAPLLEDCAARGVSVVAAAPFNSGLLAVRQPAEDARFDYGPVPPEVLSRARALADVCDSFGVELPAAALQFPLRAEPVACVVAGLRTAEEVRVAVARIQAPVPPQLWDAVEALQLTRR